jgi:hypothetical protein
MGCAKGKGVDPLHAMLLHMCVWALPALALARLALCAA